MNRTTPTNTKHLYLFNSNRYSGNLLTHKGIVCEVLNWLYY